MTLLTARDRIPRPSQTHCHSLKGEGRIRSVHIARYPAMAIPRMLIQVDEKIWCELEGLAAELTDTIGMIAPVLEMLRNRTKEDCGRPFRTAVGLSRRGTLALKQFLWVIQGVRESSKDLGVYPIEDEVIGTAKGETDATATRHPGLARS